MDRVGARRAAVAAVVGGLVAASAVVWMPAASVSAATFTQVPERLYMTPAGVTLPNGVAEFVGVKVGTLEFDGSEDPISHDTRSIVVSTLDGDAGCDLSGVPYEDDDCSRIQIGAVSHGRLWMGAITTIDDGDGDPGTSGDADNVYLLPSGALIDGPYQVAEGSFLLGINGTQQQLNDALADLVYTPDPDYYYAGFNGETVNILMTPGNSDDNLPPDDPSDDTASTSFEIRVQNVNGFPTHDGPATRTAMPNVELDMPTVADPPTAVDPVYPNAEFTVADADNDESLEIDENGNHDPDGPLPDGANSDMMLIGWLECGQPVIDAPIPQGPDHGFHFRGGAFQSDDVQIEDFLEQLYDVSSNPDYQLVIDAIVAGLDAVDPELKNITLATSNPSTYTTAFAGVADIATVAYALSQVSFRHDAPNDTCELITVVLDLGNNGLPLQYFGPAPGVEVPFLGFDWNVLTLTTGALEEIDVSFDPAPIVISETGSPNVPAEVHISPASHPEFEITWEANPRVGDPDVPGQATANSDFQGTFNNTLVIPEDATVVALNTPNVFDDGNPEPTETFTFDIVLDDVEHPDGYEIVSAVPSQTIAILDDDGGPLPSVSIADASVAEGDAGTTDLTFTLSLDSAASGAESVTVSSADGPVAAATAGVDYTALTDVPVTFAPGATTATVTVTVTGDLDVEPDEHLTLSLADPVAATIADGAAEGTIVNDDGIIGLSISDATVTEGDAGTTNATLTITLAEPAVGGETVHVETSDGTATDADDDYEPYSNDLTFVVGATEQTVTVLVNGDTDVESDETFDVTLSAPTGLLITDGLGVVTITNDDEPDSVIDIADVTIDEAAGIATLAVSNSYPSRVCAVTVTTTDGTAVSPDDFAALTAFDFVADGTDTIDVTVVDDIDVEPDETFSVAIVLAAAAEPGCVIGDGTATITITDDDDPVDTTPPSVTVDQAAGQADPTPTAPIEFTVVFSEPVNGFDETDLLLSGTAGPTTATVTGSGTTYAVLVSGMPGAGTVIVDVVAGAAIDTASLVSLASTSTDNTVTYAPDVDAPLALDVPDDIVADNEPGEAGAIVAYPAATASGGLPPIVVECDHASGAFYPIGDTVVTCTATDDASSGADRLTEAIVSGSFVITVVDVEPPTITDSADITRVATSESGVTVTFVLPTGTDNAGTPTVTCTRVSGSVFAIGATTVTCTAVDAAGNSASSSFTVTVVRPAAGVPATGGIPATGSSPLIGLLAATVALIAGVLLRSASRRKTPAPFDVS